MKHVLSLIFLLSSSLMLTAQDVDLVSLDKVLSNRNEYIETKLEMIDKLETRYKNANNDNQRLEALRDLYNEYHTFRYDSAIVKVTQMNIVAQRAHRPDYANLSKIYNAELLTTSGLFHEAMATLASVDRETLPEDYLTDFYKAYEWTYGSIADYAGSSQFSKIYHDKAMLYQDSIISTLKEGSPEYWYWMGKKQYGLNNIEDAEKYYHEAFSKIPVDNKLYSQVAYGLAKCASARGDTKERRKYLTLSAIGDQVCPLKENLALQNLAFNLAADPNEDLAKANKYLKFALADAVFFGNRLRLIEISQKIPFIVDNYEQKLNEYKEEKNIFMYVCIGFGIIILIAIVGLIYKNKQIDKLQHKLDLAHLQLSHTEK